MIRLKIKYQEVVDNKYAKSIAFLCRAINFLEDVFEDAECKDIYVDSKALNAHVVVLDAVKCKYNVLESVEIFQGKHHVDVKKGAGDLPLRELYEYVVDYYDKALRKKMKEYARKTYATGVEYYLGILFDGEGFLVEGDENRVTLPGALQCFSAHTHPSDLPVPSKNDIKAISRMLVDRGIGHVIEAVKTGLAIYRVGPLSLKDYEVLKHLEKADDVAKIIAEIAGKTVIRARYI